MTLQVVDAGGGLSPPISHKVKATAVSLHLKRTATLDVSAAVAPKRGGKHMIVTLARRRNGKFRVVVTHRETLSAHSRLAASYPMLAAGRCQLVVRYPGDKNHLAGQRSKTFAC